MPTILRMELPKPKDWQEFEDMVLHAFRLKWSSPNLQKNGRSGQKQKGVDIWGVDYLERPIGIQCKRYSEALRLSAVEEEVINSDGFSPPLNAVYLATSLPHDSKIQQQVRELSAKRVQEGKSAVGIFFWEDVVDGLVLNEDVFHLFYQNIVLPKSDGQSSRIRMRAALELGYYAASLKEYSHLLRSINDPFVVSDPTSLLFELKSNLETINIHSKLLFTRNISDSIEKYCHKMISDVDLCSSGSFAIDYGDYYHFGAKLNNGNRFLGDGEAHLYDIGFHLLRASCKLSQEESWIPIFVQNVTSIFPPLGDRLNNEMQKIASAEKRTNVADRFYQALIDEIWWGDC